MTIVYIQYASVNVTWKHMTKKTKTYVDILPGKRVDI
jgi:hypothetical protein